MSGSGKKAAFSRRDLLILVGFGFFVEVVGLYMLMIDGPLTQKARAQGVLQRTQASFTDLSSAVTARQAEAAERARQTSAINWIHVPAGSRQSLAVQQILTDLLGRSEVRLNGMTLSPEPIASTSVTAYHTTLAVAGSYDQILALSRTMGESSRSIGIEHLTVRLGSNATRELSADYELRVYVKP